MPRHAWANCVSIKVTQNAGRSVTSIRRGSACPDAICPSSSWVRRIGGTYTPCARVAEPWYRWGTGLMVKRHSNGQTRFVDVNYRIVPFTGLQTRWFFSPWPLIPSQPLHPPPFFLIHPSISVLVALCSKEPDSTEETKGKTKSTYQMCEDKGRRNHGWIPRLDTLKGTETLVPSFPIVAPAAHQAWTRTHFITYLFVPYIPLATSLLLRDEIRARDTMTKETLTRVTRIVFSLLHFFVFNRQCFTLLLCIY